MRENSLDGLQYDLPKEKDRAKRADLITLPNDVSGIRGARCGNCQFIAPSGDFCEHQAVQLPITPVMCCSFWKNPRQINSWE